MNFAEPLFLFALMLIPALMILVGWTSRRRMNSLSRLGDVTLLNELSPSVYRRGRRWRDWLWYLALAIIVVGLARPQWGSNVQVLERRGGQIMIALDISESMLAEDIEPNRLDRAKLEIIDLMNRLRGDEVGLVLFSGASFIQFPLTFDYATARTFLENANPGVISRPGTVIEEAINTAITGFDVQQTGQKVIVVITDGENHEGDPMQAVQQAVRQGVIIFTIGMGSVEGQPIPEYNAQGEVIDFKKDSQGEAILTRLDEATLQEIARQANGRYFRASDGAVAEALVRQLDRLQKTRFETEVTTFPVERFQGFLVAALVVMVASELIPDRTRKSQVTHGRLTETV